MLVHVHTCMEEKDVDVQIGILHYVNYIRDVPTLVDGGWY